LIYVVGERDPIVVTSDVFNIPESHPHAGMARAVVVEYLAGDLDVDRLDEELDWYLRGIQPPRRPREPTL
jgi:hypothetical protein